MMRSNIIKQQQKFFFIKNYRHLWQLEKAIQAIQKNATEQLQLSVLSKLGEDCISSDKELIAAKNDLKEYWKGSLGSTSDFGLFCNPEIGTLFIAGFLASQFLNDMDGKILGEMASGPYGILRGLGISGSEVSGFIKDLNEKSFLLILRGYRKELDSVREMLKA